MAEDQSSRGRERADEGDLEPSIPMKKTNPLVWVGLGGVAVIVGAVVIVGSGGGEPEARPAALKAERAGTGEPQISAKEAREHLAKTQKALAAAEAEVAATKAQEAQEAQEAKGEAEPAFAPPESAAAVAKKSSPPKASSAPAPSKADSKKKMDSLDSLGADITSALK